VSEAPLLPPLGVVVSPHEPSAPHLVGADLLARKVSLVVAVVGCGEGPLAHDRPQLGVGFREFGVV
jgi:hypothetical protein